MLSIETDGRWIAEVPSLPGCVAYGATRREAVANVEALALRVLAERLEHGEPEAMNPDELEQLAAAIEADAGQAVPDLRQSLEEMDADQRGRQYTEAQLTLRAARTALGLSQPAFARLLQTPVGTVRDWEQGRFPPPGSALLVARLALEHPDILRAYAA